MPSKRFSLILIIAALSLAGCRAPCPQAPPRSREVTGASPMQKVEIDRAALEQSLKKKHGQEQAARIKAGLDQVLALWRDVDGDAAALEKFVSEHFISDPKVLADTFSHLQYALEMLDGHNHEISRELSRYQVLAGGPLRKVDMLLAAYSPTAHVSEDLYRSKIAFVALLNWSLTTLEQRVGQGEAWSRQRWAEARLAQRFQHRVPSEIKQESARVSAQVEGYIDNYNVVMDRLQVPAGTTPFRKGLKLISHWGLRDEIRGQYARKKEGLARQRLITRVMERIIRQEIPAEVINKAGPRWDPEKNLVQREEGGAWETAEREADTRYQHLLSVFRVAKKADPHYPGMDNYIKRIFALGREMPQQRVKALLEAVLSAPAARQIGALISKRLGRPLEPFDLWYTGFQPKSELDERELDKVVRARYADAAAFDRDLPNILGKLGFAAGTAKFLADHIVVDGARGAGHASGAKRRDDAAHLRTRIPKGGMDYKGFNIAVHELGHNVEQVFSISKVDHTLLEGVPNTGFTEAFAFLFQARDLELLGQGKPAANAEALRTVDRFWNAFEIAGVGLLDMEIWQWMYDHPGATPAQLREAVVKLAKDLWNRFYAPVFGIKDVILPAIYSHIIAYGLYTPDYPLGFLITFQVEQFMKGKTMATEMERMCRLGRLAPDIWMQQAVGTPVSAAPLIKAATEAVGKIK